MRPLPSQEDLNELLTYDPETGLLTWKPRGEKWFRDCKHPWEATRWNAIFAGKNALSNIGTQGYRRGTFWNRSYQAHRIIWKMVYGVDPIDIDHIDGDRSNNRIENLRSVSRSENLRNVRTRRDNQTGVVGVSERSGRFTARIGIGGGAFKHLGSFSTIEDARNARKIAEKEYGYHENHGRVA